MPRTLLLFAIGSALIICTGLWGCHSESNVKHKAEKHLFQRGKASVSVRSTKYTKCELVFSALDSHTYYKLLEISKRTRLQPAGDEDYYNKYYLRRDSAIAWKKGLTLEVKLKNGKILKFTDDTIAYGKKGEISESFVIHLYHGYDPASDLYVLENFYWEQKYFHLINATTGKDKLIRSYALLFSPDRKYLLLQEPDAYTETPGRLQVERIWPDSLQTIIQSNKFFYTDLDEFVWLDDHTFGYKNQDEHKRIYFKAAIVEKK